MKNKIKDILLNDGYMSPLLVDEVASKIYKILDADQADPKDVAKQKKIAELKAQLNKLEDHEPKKDNEPDKEEQEDDSGTTKVMGANGILQIKHKEHPRGAKSIVARPEGLEVTPSEATPLKIGTPSAPLAPHYANPKD